MIDKVVPAGTNSFRVNTTSGLAVGQTVRVERPGTQAWINAIGMNAVPGGGPAWQPGDFNIRHDRIITRIEGDRVFLDAPLATSFDQQFGGGTLRRYTWSGRIENVGIESSAPNPTTTPHSRAATTSSTKLIPGRSSPSTRRKMYGSATAWHGTSPMPPCVPARRVNGSPWTMWTTKSRSAR